MLKKDSQNEGVKGRMHIMQGKIKKADQAVKTSEAWWSFLEQLWEARNIVIPLLGGAGFVTTALYSAISGINKFGWAGWVLASIPAIIVIGLLALFLNWLYHSFQIRKIRREREAAGFGIGEGQPDPLIDRSELHKTMGMAESQNQESAAENVRIEKLETECKELQAALDEQKNLLTKISASDQASKSEISSLQNKLAELHAEIEKQKKAIDPVLKASSAYISRKARNEFYDKLINELDEVESRLKLNLGVFDHHVWKAVEMRLHAIQQQLSTCYFDNGMLQTNISMTHPNLPAYKDYLRSMDNSKPQNFDLIDKHFLQMTKAMCYRQAVNTFKNEKLDDLGNIIAPLRHISGQEPKP